ncbi:hypothetical protein [Amycolatopsis thermoflava]
MANSFCRNGFSDTGILRRITPPVVRQAQAIRAATGAAGTAEVLRPR